jgi:hypothetical protein
MRKAALAILGALLIAGSTVQAATAENHRVRKARVAPIAASQQFRNANNSLFNQHRVITDCQYREPGIPMMSGPITLGGAPGELRAAGIAGTTVGKSPQV